MLALNKKSGRRKQGQTDIILGDNIFQREIIQKTVLQLTQSEGNAITHFLTIASVLPCSRSGIE
jgi:hypothetical protein